MKLPHGQAFAATSVALLVAGTAWSAVKDSRRAASLDAGMRNSEVPSSYADASLSYSMPASLTLPEYWIITKITRTPTGVWLGCGFGDIAVVLLRY